MDAREQMLVSLRREIKSLRQENYFLREQMNLPYRAGRQFEFDEKAIQYSPPPRTERDRTPIFDPSKSLSRPPPLPIGGFGGDMTPQHSRPANALPDLDSSRASRRMPPFDPRMVGGVDPGGLRGGGPDGLYGGGAGGLRGGGPGGDDRPRVGYDDYRGARNGGSDRYRQREPQQRGAARPGAEMSLYAMLQEYMVENELLRKEKVDMMRSKTRYERAQDKLFRENDHLRGKLDLLQQ